MQKTAILILAAGSSTRMNATKQLLRYKNTTLLGFAIETAKKSKELAKAAGNDNYVRMNDKAIAEWSMK